MPLATSPYGPYRTGSSGVIGNQLFIVGTVAHGLTLQIYDIVNRQWRLGAPPPLAIDLAGAGGSGLEIHCLATDGKLFLINSPGYVPGFGMPEVPAEMLVYDPRSNMWTSLSSELPWTSDKMVNAYAHNGQIFVFFPSRTGAFEMRASARATDGSWSPYAGAAVPAGLGWYASGSVILG